MREIQQRVRQYELMAVFSPDVTEEELPAAIERVGGYVVTAGGAVVSTNQESPWGRRRLAYPIRYQGRDVRDGYYVLYFFDIQSTQITEIERDISLNDKLIRHILTIRGEIPAAPEVEETSEPTTATAPAGAVAGTTDGSGAGETKEESKPAVVDHVEVTEPAVAETADAGAAPIEPATAAHAGAVAPAHEASDAHAETTPDAEAVTDAEKVVEADATAS